MSGFPACFESRRQFEAYQEMAAESGRTDIENGYCWDCLPSHKARMEEAERCRHPEVVFVELIEDGEPVIHGIRGEFEWYGKEGP